MSSTTINGKTLFELRNEANRKSEEKRVKRLIRKMQKYKDACRKRAKNGYSYAEFRIRRGIFFAAPHGWEFEEFFTKHCNNFEVKLNSGTHAHVSWYQRNN